MPDKTASIPVRSLAKEFDKGIAIGEFPADRLRLSEEAELSHRHDYHFFVLQVEGTSYAEIDFEKYKINSPSVIYIAPNQVHRALGNEKTSFYLLAISSENLNAHYLKLLQEISPTQPLSLPKDELPTISRSFFLAINLFDRKDGQLYHPVLKDSCNTLIGLILSLYLKNATPTDRLSRFELITKSFQLALEENLTTDKRPADYAGQLNISVSYLNECVKKTTGFPVSHHIQQRIVLEAKRLLYHSDQSIKEIAIALGYEDYAYFSRLFTKVAGMTALAFRSKNRG